MRHWNRHKWWTVCYTTVLILFTAYVLLDTFVIPRKYTVVTPQETSVRASAAAVSGSTQTTATADSAQPTASAEESASDPVVTDTSYDDGTISITISTYRENDTTVYVADITLADVSALKTAFAENTYGKNVTDKTSEIASSCGAILAINGDYYGAQNSGYVIRNGTLYRNTARSSDQEDAVIWADGSMTIVNEGDVSAESLIEQGAQQVLCFGPGLIEDGQVTVTDASEVDKAKTSNPRTAIGMISPLHYVMVVADGRTNESTGLSLLELADFMQGLGCTQAYNLDGGGSSTMVFNGTILNNPTTNGTKISERSVSDIVYIG